jgi:hypothetical protein
MRGISYAWQQTTGANRPGQENPEASAEAEKVTPDESQQ